MLRYSWKRIICYFFKKIYFIIVIHFVKSSPASLNLYSKSVAYLNTFTYKNQGR